MGLLSKIKGRAKVPVPEPDFDFDVQPLPILRSNSLISRPPPLDAKTEKELRDACAIVLADLKPSGHDLEDTRMKSDVLVDQDGAMYDRVFASSKQQQQQQQQQAVKPDARDASAPWVFSSKANPQNAAPKKPVAAPAVINHAQLATGVDMRGANAVNARSKPLAVPGRTSSQLIAEAPLAPPQSTAGSAQPLASPQPQPILHGDSSSTAASSQYPHSSEHSKSASTNLSSAPFTPSETSQRMSDTIYSHTASAKDVQWMKETAEKQRQAYANEAVPAAPAAAPSRSPATTLKSPVLDNTDRSSTGSRSRSLHSHPISDGVTQPPNQSANRPSSSSRQSVGSQKQSNLQSPATPGQQPAWSMRPASVQSKRSSRPTSGRLSTEGIKETDRSPAASPTREEVPPVPRLDADRVNSLSQRPLSQISQQWPTAMSSSSLREPSESRQPAEAAPKQRKPTPLSLAKHQQDETVVVKDFSKQPSDAQAADGFRPLNRDPRPEDFENLMSAMNQRAALPAAAAFNPDSPTVPPSTIRSLRASEKENPPQQATVIHNGVTQAIGSPSTARAHHAPSISVHSQSPSARDGAMSPSVPPSRASEARSINGVLGAKGKKEKRGVARLFWKLGGGDMPERRKIYVPPHMVSGFAGYEDYWEDADDQACAAPVVGFGRGW